MLSLGRHDVAETIECMITVGVADVFYVEDHGHDNMVSSSLSEVLRFVMYGFQNVLPRRDDFFPQLLDSLPQPYHT